MCIDIITFQIDTHYGHVTYAFINPQNNVQYVDIVNKYDAWFAPGRCINGKFNIAIRTNSDIELDKISF